MTNAVRTIQTQRLMTIGALGLMALMISEPSFAGTGGDAFTDVGDTLKDWTQGTLGRIVAGAMVLVGIVGGIARQSLMAFALGIGGGMGLYNTPTVVESVMSATLPVVASTQEVIGTTVPAISAVLLGI
jgi:conjugal transfer pilus assembly protein TraA